MKKTLLAIFLASCTSTKKNQVELLKARIPGLNKYELRTLWIPDHIEGDTFIEGHNIHVIEKGVSWKAK